MKYEKILWNLWLSKNEISIFLTLLKKWKLNISEISIETWISRPAIYIALPSLIESNLINKIVIWKRIHYKAENPDNLKSLLWNLKNNFNHILTELKDLHFSWEAKPILKSLYWKEWMMFIFSDITNTLDEWDVYYRYSSRKLCNTIWLDLTKYQEIRDKKQIERYVITSEWREKTKKKKLEKQVAVIPEADDLFDDNITKLIYKNKVAIIDYNTLTSFIIESPIFYNFELKLFKFLFKFLDSK